MDGTNNRYRRTAENKMPYRIILVLRVIHPLKNVHITQKGCHANLERIPWHLWRNQKL